MKKILVLCFIFILLAGCSQDLPESKETLYPAYSAEQKGGYINAKGNWVIPPEYEEVAYYLWSGTELF